LNKLVGNIYAWSNSKYHRLDYYLSSSFKNLDIAPQEIISVNLDASDTPREVVFSEKPFLPQEVTWSYDAEKKTLLQQNFTARSYTKGLQEIQ